MDIQSVLDSVTKSKNISGIAEQTGQSPTDVKNVIESALPSVLDNILGGSDDHEAAATTASKKSGLDINTVMTILGLVAPLVIAYITNQKSSSSPKKSESDNPLIDLATTVLDKNKDGNIVDDLLGGGASTSSKDGGGNLLTNILNSISSIFGKK